MNRDAMEYVDTMIEFYSEIEKACTEYSQKVSSKDLEIQDILHEIEDVNFNAFQGYLLCKELQSVRRERRTYKNLNEPMQTLFKFLKKNMDFLCKLKNIQHTIKNQQRKLRYGVYKPRVRRTYIIKKSA